MSAVTYGRSMVGTVLGQELLGGEINVASVWQAVRRRVALMLSVFLSGRGTTTWLAIVTTTQLILVHASTRLDTALLLNTSTNLHNLRTDALNVLVTSGCIVSSTDDYIKFTIECVIFLAPLEKMLGLGRWLIGLVVGHVGATLIVAVALSSGLLHTDGPEGRVIDVGVSYAMTCLLVVLAYRLHGLRRWGIALFVSMFVIVGLTTDASFSDWGHFVAAGLGLLIAPLLVPRRQAIAMQGREPLVVVTDSTEGDAEWFEGSKLR